MTPEQRAIEQFKAKALPRSGFGCACVGAQLTEAWIDKLNGVNMFEHWRHVPDAYVVVTIKSLSSDRINDVKYARSHLNFSIQDAKALLSGQSATAKIDYYDAQCQAAIKELRDNGADILVERYDAREPGCPCHMWHMELIDGAYYQVDQSSTGEYTAKYIGPPGGPYVEE